MLVVLALLAQTAVAQQVTVQHDANLRRDPSTAHPPVRLLRPGEPPLTMLDTGTHHGYYHVVTARAESGYVWTKLVAVSAAPAPEHLASIHPGPGVPGTASTVGCGDGLWKHVYNPGRLLVLAPCVTITGTIVDATAGHQPDGVRHEKDGDTHGWIQVDSEFANLIDPGNLSDENGNLVFEIVCHFHVSQADAVSACQGFPDHTTIPPVGTHVTMTGTLVMDTNHGKWNEIHPVSRIKP